MSEIELAMCVLQKTMASSSVAELVLGAVDGSELPAWKPGAHVDFLLPNGLTRQYSLCGRIEERKRWRFGVLREEKSRGGSAYIHDSLRLDDVIRVRGPRNNFAYREGEPALFIAGGVGITPLLPMARAAALHGTPWRMVYGGRTRDSMAFVDELSQFGGRLSLCPQDEYGLLDIEQLAKGMAPGEQIYCCGPEPLIAAVERAFAGLADQLHIERFKAEAGTQQNFAFDVVLRASNKTVRVSAEESILEALEKNGMNPPFSCREGTCGTCETVILRGRPDHRDVVLSPAEKQAGQTMMICISRSLDPEIELDA